MKKDSFLKALNGSDDVYQTKKYIAVRNISSGGYKQGKPYLKDKTRYFRKTNKRLAQSKRFVGWLRFGR